MFTTPIEPEELRTLAAQVVRELDEEGVLWPGDREAYADSLVHQWLTYDAHATLFTRESQLYLSVALGEAGAATVGREVHHGRWLDILQEDWKVRRQDLLDVLGRLNVAQSTEIVNAEGLRLRLSVDPRMHKNRVDPIDQPALPPVRRNFHRIAARAVRTQIGHWLDDADEEALASSVARQWRDHDGHAVLFLPGERLVLTFVEHGNGHGTLNVDKNNRDVTPWLHELGIEPAAVPDVLRRLNAGEQIPFRDRAGVECLLWPDPRAGWAFAQSLDSLRAQCPAVAQPLFCSQCSAVLRHWRDDEEKQICHLCGCEVMRTSPRRDWGTSA